MAKRRVRTEYKWARVGMTVRITPQARLIAFREILCTPGTITHIYWRIDEKFKMFRVRFIAPSFVYQPYLDYDMGLNEVEPWDILEYHVDNAKKY